MQQSILQVLSETVAALRRALPGLWREPLPTLPGAEEGLQIPLRPSLVARQGRWLMLFLQCLYLGQLVVLGHLRVALPVAMACGAFAWLTGATHPTAGLARRLLLSADGRMHLLETGGKVLPATLQPCSMRLGPWLLLVLRADTGTRRVLLGPDNLDPAHLAALRRQVAAITQRSGGTR